MHLFTGFCIFTFCIGNGKISECQLHCLFCQGVRKIVGRGGDVGFQSVGDHVKSGVGGDLRRNALDQIAVENCLDGKKVFGHQGILYACRLVGDDSELGYFRAGAAGGGNGNQRQSLAGFFPGNEGSGLGCVDGRTTANRNDHIRIGIQKELQRVGNQLNRRVGLDFGVDLDVFTAGKHGGDAIRGTVLGQERVGKDGSVLCLNFAQRGERIFSEAYFGFHFKLLHCC